MLQITFRQLEAFYWAGTLGTVAAAAKHRRGHQRGGHAAQHARQCHRRCARARAHRAVRCLRAIVRQAGGADFRAGRGR